MPASECGLVGLKPSKGRVSQAPLIGEAWAGATIDGVVTRSVRDTAAVLDAISGYEPGDPYIAPPFARPLLDEVGADPGRLRIGVLDRSPLVPSHPDCEAAVVAAVKLLESLGHHIDLVTANTSGTSATITTSTTRRRQRSQISASKIGSSPSSLPTPLTTSASSRA